MLDNDMKYASESIKPKLYEEMTLIRNELDRHQGKESEAFEQANAMLNKEPHRPGFIDLR